MPRYKLVPKGDHEPAYFEGIDPSAALNVARFRQYAEADVFEGDTYLFTLRHGGAMASVWTIEKRLETESHLDS